MRHAVRNLGPPRSSPPVSFLLFSLSPSPSLSTRFYLDICPLHSFYIFALLVFQEYLETNQLEPVPSTRVKVLSRRLNNVITRLEIERSGAIFSRCILFSNNPWKYLPLPGLWIEVLIVLEKERKIILLMFHFSNTLAPDCAVPPPRIEFNLGKVGQIIRWTLLPGWGNSMQNSDRSANRFCEKRKENFGSARSRCEIQIDMALFANYF